MSYGQPSRDDPDWPEWVLVGLVAAVVAVDVAALAVRGSLPYQSALRAGLAAGAALALLACFALAALRTPLYAVVGVLATPVVGVYAVTGLVLPWTALSFWLASVAMDLTLAVPVAGDALARLLLGGTTVSAATLRTAFRYHYAVVAGAGIGLLLTAGRVAWRRRVAAG